MTNPAVRQTLQTMDLSVAVFRQTRDAILVFDRNLRLVDANGAARELLHLSGNPAGGTCRELFHCEHLGMSCFAGKAMMPQKSYISEIARIMDASGRQNHVWITAFALVDEGGDIIGAAEVIRDIEDIRHIDSALLERAATDPLTGLWSRRIVENAIAVETSRSARHGRTFSILLADIDRFKRYNDCHGPTAGDNALRFTAGILTAHTRKEDTVIRYGGDAFLILAPETGRAGALIMADRLRAKIHTISNMTPNLEGRLSVSVGATCSANGAVSDANRLLRAADAALNAARNAGGDRCVFAPCEPGETQNRESA